MIHHQALGTPSLPLALARSVLTHHGLSSPSMMLDPVELRELLRELYCRAQRARGGRREGREEEAEVLASMVETLLDPGHQVGRSGE